MSKMNFKSKRGRRSRSSYTSAALCIAAVAIALCAVAVRAQKDKSSITDETASTSSAAQTTKTTAAAVTQPSANEETTPASAPNVSNSVKNENKPAVQNPTADEYEDFEDSEQTLAIQTMGKAGGYVRPVGGAVTKEYSMTGLVYSRTMGDWRVHNGLDLSASKGEVVKSVAEGTVAGITNDLLYGTTVVINQNDGLMVYYRGLSKDTAVRQGENIAAGATIGTVDEIPCENGDGYHLHIEVVKDGNNLSPADILGLK